MSDTASQTETLPERESMEFDVVIVKCRAAKRPGTGAARGQTLGQKVRAIGKIEAGHADSLVCPAPGRKLSPLFAALLRTSFVGQRSGTCVIPNCPSSCGS